MAVRNFYVEAAIDGRATGLGSGPRAKDGGMQVRIYQRSNGDITNPVYITGWVAENGSTLVLEISVDGHAPIHLETRR